MPIQSIVFASTHCINDFDLGESELSGGNCEERRELKPNGNVSDHDTVIISQHEVINQSTTSPSVFLSIMVVRSEVP